MKTLNFNDEQFQAEKIIKTENSIIGQDSNDNVLFTFKGISDFTLFTLDGNQEFDVAEPSKAELKELIDIQNQAIAELTMMVAIK